jgi:hypothetical protein
VLVPFAGVGVAVGTLGVVAVGVVAVGWGIVGTVTVGVGVVGGAATVGVAAGGFAFGFGCGWFRLVEPFVEATGVVPADGCGFPGFGFPDFGPFFGPFGFPGFAFGAFSAFLPCCFGFGTEGTVGFSGFAGSSGCTPLVSRWALPENAALAPFAAFFTAFVLVAPGLEAVGGDGGGG